MVEALNNATLAVFTHVLIIRERVAQLNNVSHRGVFHVVSASWHMALSSQVILVTRFCSLLRSVLS